MQLSQFGQKNIFFGILSGVWNLKSKAKVKKEPEKEKEKEVVVESETERQRQRSRRNLIHLCEHVLKQPKKPTEQLILWNRTNRVRSEYFILYFIYNYFK